MIHGKRSAGFTLIELLVTLVIVGLLASVALPMAELTVQRSREHDLRIALREIRGAIDAYKKAWDEGRIATAVGKSGYPATLDVLVDGVDDPSSPNQAKIYFLRRIPRDPFAIDPNLSPAETWGKRSYASSATEPQEGDDVYDVYTRNPGNDLRGIAYREW